MVRRFIRIGTEGGSDMTKRDEIAGTEVDRRFRKVLRGALHTPPLSNEKIIEKAAAERVPADKARQLRKPSGASKKGKRSE